MFAAGKKPGVNKLRIALVQMVCEKAASVDNLALMARYLDEAKARRIDIVGFPEMSMGGYADPNRYPQAIFRMDGPEVERLLEMTQGNPAIVLAGLIEQNPEPAAKPFITQIAVQDGELLGRYRKRTIVDEEALWFSPGDMPPLFTRDGLPFGISICADIGNESVFTHLAGQGAQIVFELAAPGLYGEQWSRNWQSGFDWWKETCAKKLAAYAEKYGVWIAVATQAGRTVDEDFPGGGYVFAPDGRRLYATPDWSPGIVYLELDLEAVTATPIEAPRA